MQPPFYLKRNGRLLQSGDLSVRKKFILFLLLEIANWPVLRVVHRRMRSDRGDWESVADAA